MKASNSRLASYPDLMRGRLFGASESDLEFGTIDDSADEIAFGEFIENEKPVPTILSDSTGTEIP